MKGNPDNLLIVWDRIGDYHRARVEALRRELTEGTVFTADLGSADGLYKWSTAETDGTHFRLSDKPVGQGDFLRRGWRFWRLVWNHGVRRVAVAGYGRPSYVLILLLARLMGLRVSLFAESWYGTNRVKNRIKGIFLRTVCKGYLLSGKRAKEHFQDQLGIPEDQIFLPYSVVDNSHFKPQGNMERQRLLLCVARFSPEKHLDLLIKAFQESSLKESWKLRLIGGGPDKAALEALISDPERVELLDWVSYEALPRHYQEAACFILPSRFEPWGLVVNEAMAAGLPIIVSEACGCAPDLVGPGNGYRFSTADKSELKRLLETLPEPGSTEWARMGAASLKQIEAFSCSVWANALLKSLRA